LADVVVVSEISGNFFPRIRGISRAGARNEAAAGPPAVLGAAVDLLAFARRGPSVDRSPILDPDMAGVKNYSVKEKDAGRRPGAPPGRPGVTFHVWRRFPAWQATC